MPKINKIKVNVVDCFLLMSDTQVVDIWPVDIAETIIEETGGGCQCR